MRRARAVRIALSLFALTGCDTQLVIGVEHRIVPTAVGVDSRGELLQAGRQEGDLWYGRVAADGGLLRSERVDFAGADDGAAAVAVLSDGWAVVGTVTGEDGRGRAWVRRLDATDNEVWTRTFEPPPGLSWETTSMAVDPEGTLVVVGIERGSGPLEHGFIMRLDAQGMRRWSHSLTNGLQQMAARARLYGVATVGASLRRVFAVGDRELSGARVPVGFHFTLDGDLYDSYFITTQPGVAKGLFMDGDQAVTCFQTGDQIEVRRSSWALGTEIRHQTLSVSGSRLELRGCALASDGDVLVGANFVGASTSTPFTARVDSQVTLVKAQGPLTTERPATLFGLGGDATGTGWVVGQLQQPLRRWAQHAFDR